MPSAVYVPGTFRLAGWSFLFLGVTIGPFVRTRDETFVIDLLPDFVGYLMIAVAAMRLVPLHRQARGVRNLALLLTYLSIPLVVQYTVTTSQVGNVTFWRAPLWPLTLATAILEIVLVWKFCGIVADLARRAGVDSTARSARMLRLAYVFMKFLMAVGIAVALLSPNPSMILDVAIAELACGLVLLVLMMTLMRQMDRIAVARADLISDAADGPRKSGGLLALGLFLGGWLLPLALGIAGALYFIDWKATRNEESRQMSSSVFFTPARDEFFGHLEAGRVDEAYASTTAGFKSRVSPDQFAELARQYARYVKVREAHNSLGSGASMSSGDQSLSEQEYIEFEKGKVIEVSTTIRRDRDSIFYRRPPPVRVDEFKVEEKAMERPRPDFGR